MLYFLTVSLGSSRMSKMCSKLNTEIQIYDIYIDKLIHKYVVFVQYISVFVLLKNIALGPDLPHKIFHGPDLQLLIVNDVLYCELS